MSAGLPFVKMQAQGNDFVLLDGLRHALPSPDADFVRRIAERRYGVGCDQVLLLEPCKDADAAMRIFNSDGSEAANCGNGLRCAAEHLMRAHGIAAPRIRLADRIVPARRGAAGIGVAMGAARIEAREGAHVDVNIGNAHRVFFEATEDFPADRNVEIVTGQAADRIWIEIIERGAGRTLACGSGACAAAVAVWALDGRIRPLEVAMPGGIVRVSGKPEALLLEGEVSRVFEGVLALQPDG